MLETSLSWPPARTRLPETSWTATPACPLTGAAGSASARPTTWPGPWCAPGGGHAPHRPEAALDAAPRACAAWYPVDLTSPRRRDHPRPETSRCRQQATTLSGVWRVAVTVAAPMRHPLDAPHARAPMGALRRDQPGEVSASACPTMRAGQTSPERLRHRPPGRTYPCRTEASFSPTGARGRLPPGPTRLGHGPAPVRTHAAGRDRRFWYQPEVSPCFQREPAFVSPGTSPTYAMSHGAQIALERMTPCSSSPGCRPVRDRLGPGLQTPSWAEPPGVDPRLPGLPDGEADPAEVDA